MLVARNKCYDMLCYSIERDRCMSNDFNVNRSDVFWVSPPTRHERKPHAAGNPNDAMNRYPDASAAPCSFPTPLPYRGD